MLQVSIELSINLKYVTIASDGPLYEGRSRDSGLGNVPHVLIGVGLIMVR